jgi:hypothetical protein
MFQNAPDVIACSKPAKVQRLLRLATPGRGAQLVRAQWILLVPGIAVSLLHCGLNTERTTGG